MGSGILVAQLYGAKSKDITKTINTAYIIAFFVGTGMGIVGQLAAKGLLNLLKTPANIYDNALIYLRITFLGCTGQLFYFMGSGMLRSMGDSKWPMYFGIICAILNIVGDLLLVIVFDMGVAGVAIATIVSQLISAILVIIRTYRSKAYGLNMTRENFRPDFRILKDILKIGVPGAINSLTNSVGLMIIQSYANSFGSDFVACNTVVQKVDSFALLPLMALGQGLTTFSGQNIGAGREDGQRRSKEVGTSCLYSQFYQVSCFSALDCCKKAFTTNEAVIGLCIKALRVVAYFYGVMAVQRAVHAMLQGSGAMLPIMIISVLQL